MAGCVSHRQPPGCQARMGVRLKADEEGPASKRSGWWQDSAPVGSWQRPLRTLGSPARQWAPRNEQRWGQKERNGNLRPRGRGAGPSYPAAQKQVTGPGQRPRWEGLCFVLRERWTVLGWTCGGTTQAVRNVRWPRAVSKWGRHSLNSPEPGCLLALCWLAWGPTSPETEPAEGPQGWPWGPHSHVPLWAL